MNWYHYLSYRIYCFYRRKRDSTPQLFSFLATVVLIGTNILSIKILLSFIFPLLKQTSKYYVLGLFAFLSLLNYLFLYRNKYYEEVFDDFDRHGEKYSHWNRSVSWYIVLSIAFMLGVLVLADLRNHGHL
jgi:Ca2+/H+ antiporter